jgi:hypothetical protein
LGEEEVNPKRREIERKRRKLNIWRTGQGGFAAMKTVCIAIKKKCDDLLLQNFR